MLCLFDLDGTLIDSERGITACVKHALARLDVPAPADEELRGWIGPPLRHSFAPLLDHDAARIETAIEHYASTRTAGASMRSIRASKR